MTFPETKRYLYQKNSLERVICQLRFPPILKIDTELPSEFQERIRNFFTDFNETNEHKHEIILNSEKLQPINPLSNVETIKNYIFETNDKKWQINLTRTFISISTSEYSDWKNFINNFQEPIKALEDIYNPAFYSRLGLRYINVFCPSQLDLGENPQWNDYIKREFTGLLSSDLDSIKKSVNGFSSVFEIELNNDIGKARIISQLVKKSDNINNSEICFMLDNDLFNTDKTSYSELENKLYLLHDQATKLYSYAITENLQSKLEPGNND